VCEEGNNQNYSFVINENHTARDSDDWMGLLFIRLDKHRKNGEKKNTKRNVS